MAPHSPHRAGTSLGLSSAFCPLFLEPSTVDCIYCHGFHLSLNTGDFQICSPFAYWSPCDTFYTFLLQIPQTQDVCSLLGADITKYHRLGPKTEIYFVTILKARNPRSRFWLIQLLVWAALSRVRAWPFLGACIGREGGSTSSLVSLLIRTLTLSDMDLNPVASFSLYYFYRGPISKSSHIRG